MRTPLKDIAAQLNGKIVGDPTLLIKGVASIEDAEEGEITFVVDAKNEKHAATTGASVLIVRAPLQGLQKTFLLTDNPYYAFAQLLAFFHPPRRYQPGVDPMAVLGEKVEVGEGASVGPLAMLEDRVKIGEGVRIGAGVFVGEGSEVGLKSVIHPNVTILEGVRIGRRVIVHSGTVIGADGFGFAPYKGTFHKVPQVGGVIIEDDVELGSNVSVDRGTLGNTIVGKGTKVDNLVQIGHNVVIGHDTVLVSQVGLSGSVTLGHHVTLAGQVGVAGHLSIGDSTIIGGKSGVTKDIPSGRRFSGFPPIPHQDWLKAKVIFRHLPALKNEVKTLTKKLEALEAALANLKNNAEN